MRRYKQQIRQAMDDGMTVGSREYEMGIAHFVTPGFYDVKNSLLPTLTALLPSL